MNSKEVLELLVKELKAEGLDVAEDTAVAAVKAVFKVMPKVFVASENKFDDLLVPVLGVLEPKVMELLDKIDGKEG